MSSNDGAKKTLVRNDDEILRFGKRIFLRGVRSTLSKRATCLAAGFLALFLQVGSALAQGSWSWSTFGGGSYATSINSNQVVAGFGIDPRDYNLLHGFLRSSDGVISLFDVQGAKRTYVNSINGSAAITGSFDTGDSQLHAFMTDPSRQTVFTMTYFKSEAFSINDGGIAVGYYDNFSTWVPFYWQNGVKHDIVIPGSTWGLAQTIDSYGNIAGKAGYPISGFVRDTQGGVSTFTISGMKDINIGGIANGAVAGSYVDANGATHGFLRSMNGVRSRYWSIMSFDIPGSTSIVVRALTTAGVIAGYFLDFQSKAHGFLVSPQGFLTIVDMPGSANTYLNGLTNDGAITGAWIPSGGFLPVSFLAKPN